MSATCKQMQIDPLIHHITCFPDHDLKFLTENSTRRVEICMFDKNGHLFDCTLEKMILSTKTFFSKSNKIGFRILSTVCHIYIDFKTGMKIKLFFIYLFQNTLPIANIFIFRFNWKSPPEIGGKIFLLTCSTF